MNTKKMENEMLEILKQFSDKKGVVWYWDLEDNVKTIANQKATPKLIDEILDSLEEKGYIAPCTKEGKLITKKSQPNAEFYKIIKK